MGPMLDKRVVFVTGKGGVGKSTVAAALGLVAARRGKRTMICEVSQQERMSAVFHREGVGYHETELADNLFAFSIDPQRALEEYLLLQIRIRPLYEMLFRNRVFTYFAAATPGMRELVTVGKIWELAQLDRKVKKGAKYDLVIVDAPATGHGLAILRTPKTFGEIARMGPIKRQADAINDFITNPDLTSICAVALPEEMPVNETLDFASRLRNDVGLEVERIFMNAVYPPLFDDDEAAAISDLHRHESANGSSGEGGTIVRRAALRAAVSEHRRAADHGRQLKRLGRESGLEPVQLPFLFRREIDMDAIASLADILEETQ